MKSFIALVIVVTTLCSCGKTETYPTSGGGPAEAGAPAGTPSEKPGDDNYKVRFKTTKGDFVIEVRTQWAPRGAARFRELVEKKFFTENYFYRTIAGFVVQWGLCGDPALNNAWAPKTILDEPSKAKNDKGTICFGRGPGRPNSRCTQVFINLSDNPNLDQIGGFPPFGRVVEGMRVVESLYSGYGNTLDSRDRVKMARYKDFLTRGNIALETHYPKLDKILSASIE